MSANNGGPAFPCEREYGPKLESAEGLSMRDYFAAKAIGPIVTCPFPLREMGYSMQNGLSIMENYAALAYQIADAMLSERAK